MILFYGIYQHPDNEANATITRQGLEADDGFIYGYTETWNITGIMHFDSDADMVTQMAALVAAYSLQGQNLIWYKGGTIMHQLISANTLAGTRVTVLPHFPRNENGELTSFRTYAMTVEADVTFLPVSTLAPQILKYEQSLNFTGTGGPKFIHLPTLTGLHQKQQLTETSPIILVQSGVKTGLGAYPTPDPPLWPDYEHQERRQINYGTVRRRNGVDTEFPVHWSYNFEHNQTF